MPDTGIYSPVASVSNRDRLDLAIFDDELLPTGSKFWVPVRKFTKESETIYKEKHITDEAKQKVEVFDKIC